MDDNGQTQLEKAGMYYPFRIGHSTYDHTLIAHIQLQHTVSFADLHSFENHAEVGTWGGEPHTIYHSA